MSDFSECQAHRGTAIISEIKNRRNALNSVEHSYFHDLNIEDDYLTVLLKNGASFIHSVNASNIVQLTDVFWIESESETSHTKFVQITNNHLRRHGFLLFSNSNHVVDNCNIIDNVMDGLGSINHGIILSFSASVTVKNSNIIGSCPENKVFFYSDGNGIITVSNCFFNQEKIYGQIKITKKAISKISIGFPSIASPNFANAVTDQCKIKFQIIHLIFCIDK